MAPRAQAPRGGCRRRVAFVVVVVLVVLVLWRLVAVFRRCVALVVVGVVASLSSGPFR